ncbi:MAG: hypothetical protein AAB893_02875 [Patescibacteria group bacterium]
MVETINPRVLTLLVDDELKEHVGDDKVVVGVYDSLDELVTEAKAAGHTFRGLFESCMSRRFVLEGRTIEPVLILDLVFLDQSRQRVDYCYIGKNANDSEWVRKEIERLMN